MVDISILGQAVDVSVLVGFLGGSGLTGLIVALYQLREARMVQAIEFFREMVLTPELFRALRIYHDVLSLLCEYDKLQQGEEVWLEVNGLYQQVGDIKELDAMLETLGYELSAAIRKTKETGVWFLLPDTLRGDLNAIPSPPQVLGATGEERRKLLQTYDNKLRAVRDRMRKALGIKRLE